MPSTKQDVASDRVLVRHGQRRASRLLTAIPGPGRAAGSKRACEHAGFWPGRGALPGSSSCSRRPQPSPASGSLNLAAPTSSLPPGTPHCRSEGYGVADGSERQGRRQRTLPRRRWREGARREGVGGARGARAAWRWAAVNGRRGAALPIVPRDA